MHSDKPVAAPRAVSERRGRSGRASRIADTGARQAATASGPFSARYSDGRSAVAHNADVRIEGGSLVITLNDTAQRIVWPLATLRTAQPLTHRSTDVLVGQIGEEAATLFVADARFAEKLAAAAPGLSARSQRWRHARPWLILAGLAAVAAGAVAALDLSPARTVASLLPDTVRQKMGDEAIRSMTKGRRVCDAREGRAALDRLAARLGAALPAEQRRFKVTVVDWGLMNAFAVPGGQIVLTRGLLTRTESADEVAGVLAHEMGHSIELHPEAAMVRALGMTAVADLVFGSGTVTNIGLMLAQLSYSRDAERQADRQALALLRSSAISPQGLAAFFRRVMKTEGGSSVSKKLPGRSIDVLSTHPATEERTRMVERQPDYPATPALGVEDWQALRNICGAAVSTPSGANESKDGSAKRPPTVPRKAPPQRAPSPPPSTPPAPPAPAGERPISL